jgi:hypothetical protein
MRAIRACYTERLMFFVTRPNGSYSSAMRAIRACYTERLRFCLTCAVVVKSNAHELVVVLSNILWVLTN